MENKLEGSSLENKEYDFNILSNLEKTISAMADIEGEFWEREERKMLDSNNPKEKTLAMAVDQFKTRKFPPDRIIFIVYGSGGLRRYAVRGDGSVLFSKFHSDNDSIQKAINLGFKMY